MTSALRNTLAAATVVLTDELQRSLEHIVLAREEEGGSWWSRSSSLAAGGSIVVVHVELSLQSGGPNIAGERCCPGRG